VTESADPGGAPGRPDRPDPDHVLTWRQRKILRYIADCVARSGYPPSMEEIGAAVGLVSTSSVSYQISVLERKGYLHRDGRRPRTVEVRLPRQQAAADRENRDERATDQPGGGIPDIPSQAAVKTLKRSDGSDWLVSHNPAYTPIPADDATILGKVVAVLRRVGDLSGDDPAGAAVPDGVLAP